jgi:ubiquinone/menaquinone biosynthesis C-methylase UbiE
MTLCGAQITAPGGCLPEIIAYDTERASAYHRHHRKNLRTRISTARERQLVGRALATFRRTETVLDLACGTGRFWPVIDARASSIVAVDNSDAMLREAVEHAAPNAHRTAVCGSAFALPFRERTFDVVVCMRFLHHLAHRDDRLAALADIRRVTRDGAVVSLWTDGSREGRRRLREQHASTLPRGFGRRVCVERTTIERDFADAGFSAAIGFDFAPGLSMWRVYALHCAD